MSGMTDADYLDAIANGRYQVIESAAHHKERLRHIAARLRGDGEQGQAVTAEDEVAQVVARLRSRIGELKGGLEGSWVRWQRDTYARIVEELEHDRPQPVAVAGDAIEAIALALWHRFAPDDRIEWEDESEKAIYRDSARQVAALCAPAVPAQSDSAIYSLDADPLGIRDRAAAAITGALMLGSRGNNPPPSGHWLQPFWDMARAEAVLRESPAPSEQVAASVAVPGDATVDRAAMALANVGRLGDADRRWHWLGEHDREKFRIQARAVLDALAAAPVAPEREG